MGSRTCRSMPEKRQENAVQKMLVMKQMAQVVDPDPGSMVDDSMSELRREPAASWRTRIDCRSGDGCAFGMGSGAASRPGQS